MLDSPRGDEIGSTPIFEARAPGASATRSAPRSWARASRRHGGRRVSIDRGQHLDVLLQQLTSHTVVARHYVPSPQEGGHGPTYGRAAELGLSEVLSAVLPDRLRASTGFIRGASNSLLGFTEADGISGQTDVLIYDHSWTTPLHSIGEIDIVASPDVRGYFEVKDTSEIGDALKEALEQIKRVRQQQSSTSTLAGLFMMQGGGASFRGALADKLGGVSFEEAPDLVYIRALGCSPENDWSHRHSTLAYMNHARATLHVLRCKESRDALALFLRMITGWFAVQGVISPALAHDLRPEGNREPGKFREYEAIELTRQFQRTDETDALFDEAPGSIETPEALIKHLFETEGRGIHHVHERPGFINEGGPNSWPTACITLEFRAINSQAYTFTFTQDFRGVYRCSREGLAWWRVYRETPIEQVRRLAKQLGISEGIFLPQPRSSHVSTRHEEPSKFSPEEE